MALSCYPPYYFDHLQCKTHGQFLGFLLIISGFPSVLSTNPQCDLQGPCNLSLRPQPLSLLRPRHLGILVIFIFTRQVFLLRTGQWIHTVLNAQTLLLLPGINFSFFKATNQVTYQYLGVHLNFKIKTLIEDKYTNYSSDVKASNTSGQQMQAQFQDSSLSRTQ